MGCQDGDMINGRTLVERAAALTPLVRDHADQADADRHLNETVAVALAEAGLHRLGAPPSYAGADASPRHQLEAIEAIAYADGATGWNLMIGVENLALMALQWRHGAELLSDPLTIVCGSTAAVCRADAVKGGWQITGRWPWASGCHNAHWFGGQVLAFSGDEQVSPRPVYAFARRGEFEILDTWHTSGMRGSGSHDVLIDGLVVPEEQIAFYDKAWVAQQRAESVLARIPLGVRLAHNKTAVALGIARAAVDVFIELAAHKTPAFGSVSLAERPFAQQALARAESRLRAGRAWVLDECDHAWERASRHEPFTDKQKAVFLMACADTTAGCVEAVESVVEAAGTTANMAGHPLDRLRRNATVVRSHVTVAPHLRDEAAARLLGITTPSFLFDLP